MKAEDVEKIREDNVSLIHSLYKILETHYFAKDKQDMKDFADMVVNKLGKERIIKFLSES